MIHPQPDPALPAPGHDPAPAPPASVWFRRTRILAIGWALLGSLALAAVYARAALRHLTTGVVGGDIDGYENLWNHWWVQTALRDLHQSPLFTNYLYYPTGSSLRYHALSATTGLLAIPLDALLGQDDLISGEGLPFYFLCLFRALSGRPPAENPLATPAPPPPRRWLRWAALAVLTLLIFSLTDWEYVMWAVFATLLYGAFLLVTRRPWAAKARLCGRLALVGGTLTVALDGAAVTTLALNPAAGGMPVRVDLTLAPGHHMITFQSPEPALPTGNPADTRRLSFGMYDVGLQAK